MYLKLHCSIPFYTSACFFLLLLLLHYTVFFLSKITFWTDYLFFSPNCRSRINTMLWHLVLQLALHRNRLQSKNVQYLHMLARSCSDGREERRVRPAAGTPRLKQRQVPLSATPFLAPPSPLTPCWPSIWVNPPCFYVIAPCRECSLAFFFALQLLACRVPICWLNLSSQVCLFAFVCSFYLESNSVINANLHCSVGRSHSL